MAIEVTNQTFLLNSSLFWGKSNITSVDLCNLPFEANKMEYTFDGCLSLKEVKNITNSVTTMNGAFANCTNLEKPPKLPANLTNQFATFEGCSSLSEPPVIPNSLVSMQNMFSGCSSLKEPPVIPNSVEVIQSAFENCTKLLHAPTLPNSITSMRKAFYNCTNMINFPELPPNITYISNAFVNCRNITHVSELPNKVAGMDNAFKDCVNLIKVNKMSPNAVNLCWAFQNCSNLVSFPRIGDRVTNMTGCFSGCTNIGGTIFINSENISNASSCFDGTDTNIIKTVYIPFTYENNVNTETYDSFTTAGYYINGVNGIRIKDINQRYYTIKIAPTPPDSIVTMHCGDYPDDGRKMSVPANSTLSYTIERDGYYTQTNSFIVNRSDTLRIELNRVLFTLTIAPTPNDASVTLESAGYIQQGKSISVPYNTPVVYTVSKQYYETVTNTIYVTNNYTLPVELQRNLWVLTINPTPNDATVLLTANGYQPSYDSIAVSAGTTVNYTVNKTSDWETKFGNVVVNEDMVKDVEIYQEKSMNITDYDCEVDGNKYLTLTKYTGSGTNVVIPNP